MFLALAAIGLASCNGGYKKAPGGLLYDIVTDKAGPSIQPGDFMSIDITMKNDADSVLGTTYDQGVLTITIPVAEHAKPRRVEITTSGASLCSNRARPAWPSAASSTA